MKARFEDILSRIKEEPDWYDQNGTPRYGAFQPDHSPNIYADECVLMEIACQACHRRFFVEMNWWQFNHSSFSERIWRYLKDRKKSKKNLWVPLHYGDPPIHGCIGDTMNCDDIRILEFAKKNDNREWKRIRKYEVKFL